ncbi:nitrate transporter [Grosmannia clavigera kw1407]|uniref:Nitrate/nitrite transporter n=1 Tax=Grosmannia clavigera (strain kw1407 / UAMH 11150) TaxID=655863 RepID=F0X943_GROCL|nr:nitrate transporter [Grosmannia clavigera kw1407]EFX05993.1 nitrate transporter [Grosmannia clavigera kw1407]
MAIGFKVRDLWRAPVLNPINRKARSIPFLNPINMYGRVFFFAWFGFMIAFWAWYAFPPLLTVTIKKDLKLTPAQVANSNIVSLSATLLVRIISGPLCDQFGPRIVFGFILLLGAIPVGLSPLVQSAGGLYTARFFTGILGGSFVPCMVWSTGFFDKNVVGTANALTGGFGNAGGGVTYFIMPAVYDSLRKHRGYKPDKAWRVTFVVPLIMVIATGVALLLLCPDTPDGKWKDRELHAKKNLEEHNVHVAAAPSPVVDVPGSIMDKQQRSRTETSNGGGTEDAIKDDIRFVDHEAHLDRDEMLETAQGEIVVKPTAKEALEVAVSLQTVMIVLTYMCSFGAELAINSILAAYYLKKFPKLGQTKASDWAAMFAFLNLLTRPLGGIISDLLYNSYGRNLWLKKGWITICGVLSGVFLIVVGQVDSHNESTVYGLIALAAIFIQAGNGANFSLVPHVHPFANGIVSGLAGAGGNMGGIFFAVIFRFMDNGTNYAKAFWVIGVIHIGVNLAVSWIPPVPKNQIGGR